MTDGPPDAKVTELERDVAFLKAERARSRKRVVALLVVFGIVLYALGTAAWFAWHERADAIAQEALRADQAEDLSRRCGTELAAIREAEPRAEESRLRLASEERERLTRHHVVTDALVTNASGRTHVRPGEVCQVELQWTIDTNERCRAFVTCGTTRLYGDPGLGYFDCDRDARQVRTGHDEQTVEQDGDALLVLTYGTLEIHDLTPEWDVVMRLSSFSADEEETIGETGL